MNFKIKGIHHIKLTVSDLERSKSFYENLPQFTLVADYPNFIMFDAGSFYLGLTDHKGKLDTKKFNEKNIGLDHKASRVASKSDLHNALSYFKKENIKHGKIKKLSNNVYVLSFRDPDDIQLELAWRKT